MTPAETAEVLAMLHGGFPGTDIDDAVAIAWKNSMQTDDFDLAMRAAEEWVRTQQFFPKIVELRTAMRHLREGDELDAPALPPAGDEEAVDRQRAHRAFMDGFTRARSRAGDDLDTIEEKGARYFKRWADQLGLPTSDEAR